MEQQTHSQKEQNPAAAPTSAGEPPPVLSATKTPTIDIRNTPETTGEKWFRRLRFWLAESVILVSGAWLAYYTMYKENFLHRWMSKVNKGLTDNRFFTMPERQGGIVASTMILGNPGNFYAPIMYGIDYYEKKIVDYFNRHWGTPEEEKIADERLKDKPKPTLFGVISGRVVSYIIVFAAFLGADWLLGKNKKTGAYRFDQFEDLFGRKFSGWFGGNKQILELKSPLGVKGSVPEALSKDSYKFGKILSLDIFATTSAVIAWIGLNKIFASKAAKKSQTDDKLIPAYVPEASKSQEVTSLGAAEAEGPSLKQHAESIPSRAAVGQANFVKNVEISPAAAIQGI